MMGFLDMSAGPRKPSTLVRTGRGLDLFDCGISFERRAAIVGTRGRKSGVTKSIEELVHRRGRPSPLFTEAVLVVVSGGREFGVERREQVAGTVGGSQLVRNVVANSIDEIAIVGATQPYRSGGSNPFTTDRTRFGRMRDESVLGF